MTESVFGQDHAVEALLLALLADGHVLTRGWQGLRAIRYLWSNLDAAFLRTQFTDDLLPADVTGARFDGSGQEIFASPGPLFANIILADDINFAPPDTQAVLLEAMEQRRVWAAGAWR